MSRARARAFTLLEVIVAISILALGMTVILGSQVGLFSSAKRAENLSVASNLARCKMSELELDLLKDGYPAADTTDEGECCEEQDDKTYTCSWKVELVQLPQPKDLSAGGGDGGLGDDQGGLGALGALAQVQAGGGALGGDGGVGDLASMLGSAASSGTQGMAPMVMSMVYPDLKPMLEASIRKVTLKVEWREGVNQRDLTVTQYITNPQQGGLDPNAAKNLQVLEE